MRKKSCFLATLLALAAFAIAGVYPSSAATYYIDYASGSDSNEGTSKATAWRRHPYMKGWDGSYNHAVGDHFIFKGGVTWPNSTMQLLITRGGTAGNPDVYGVDKTWYHGGSWSRPRFDGEGLPVADSRVTTTAGSNCMVQVQADNVTIDNIEVTGLKITTYNGSGFTGCSFIVNNAAGVLFTNCYAHDWVYAVPVPVPKPSSDIEDGKNGGFFNYNGGAIARHCAVKGPTNIDPIYKSNANGNTSGAGFNHFTEVDHCDISEVSQGTWFCTWVHHSVIHDCCDSVDSNNHENGFWIVRSGTFNNNIVHGVRAGVTGFTQVAWGSEGANHLKFYNNLLYGNASQFLVEEEGSPTENTNLTEIYNNTFVGTYVKIATKSSAANATEFRVQNNIMIRDGTTITVNSAAIKEMSAIDTNKVYTAAAATIAGLVSANLWKLKTTILGVTGAGLDKSGVFNTDLQGLQRTAPWDLGAFKFSPPPTPPNRPWIQEAD